MCATLMEIMKDDIDKQVQQGIQQGMKQGTDQGLGDTTKLMNYLWENGRGADAEKAEKDKSFLQKLLDEFKSMEPAVG